MDLSCYLKRGEKPLEPARVSLIFSLRFLDDCVLRHRKIEYGSIYIPAYTGLVIAIYVASQQSPPFYYESFSAIVPGMTRRILVAQILPSGEGKGPSGYRC